MSAGTRDSLHRWLAAQPWPEGLAGSRGHDAAVLEPMAGRVAFYADQCIEGVHFEPNVDLALAGRKAVLRRLSDLAATRASHGGDAHPERGGHARRVTRRACS